MTTPKSFSIFLLFFLLISSFLLYAYGVHDDTNVIRIGAIIDVNSRIGKEQQIAMEIGAQKYNDTSETYKLALYFRNTSEEAFRVASLGKQSLAFTKKIIS